MLIYFRLLDERPAMRWTVKLNYRFYLILLCLAYFSMLYVFHGNLQVEVNPKCLSDSCLLRSEKNSVISSGANSDPVASEHNRTKLELRNIKGLEIRNFSMKDASASNFLGNQIKPRNTSELPVYVEYSNKLSSNRDCYLPANFSSRKFCSLEPDSFVYSAYYDERYSKQFVRIMAVLSLNKAKRKLKVYCHFKFNQTTLDREATFYELCENHGKPYGGFMLSCEVPKEVTDICTISVSMNILPLVSHYSPPSTAVQTLQVTRLRLDPAKDKKEFDFTICVPPLFGSIATEKLVEFIELNRILGFQHFIMYTAKIDNVDVLKVLEYYRLKNIVTVIDFTLPDAIPKSKIWYNGQLSSHNDCLYRAMSITNFVALMDIDEFIVPHNGQVTVTDTIKTQFLTSDKICGVSFDSAFYDSKFSKSLSEKESYLVTQTITGRSEMFSKVRTKVLVRPEKIFEVGIHHISKPAQEAYHVLKMNTSLVYLHHYRSCVPNYGMKCNTFREDLTMLQYGKQLEDTVEAVFEEVFDKNHELK